MPDHKNGTCLEGQFRFLALECHQTVRETRKTEPLFYRVQPSFEGLKREGSGGFEPTLSSSGDGSLSRG